MSGKRQASVRRLSAQMPLVNGSRRFLTMTNFRSALSLALLGCAAIAPAARAITLPSETAIPVVFTHTVDAKKAKAGDVVTAKTMQVVLLPNGEQLPKGTLVTGHVVEARPFNFDKTPYAAKHPPLSRSTSAPPVRMH